MNRYFGSVLIELFRSFVTFILSHVIIFLGVRNILFILLFTICLLIFDIYIIKRLDTFYPVLLGKSYSLAAFDQLELYYDISRWYYFKQDYYTVLDTTKLV